MDVTGWSKLNIAQIESYVSNGMPYIAKQLRGHDFLNTWGDAIVATFSSARDAAESALNLRDAFVKGLESQGIAQGLSCRIALHQGEVLECHNVLINKRDIFGEQVHVAARLEPATAPSRIFCTDTFANALMPGLGPRAWLLGTLPLAKGFGEREIFVVTWPNDADPRPALKDFLSPPVATPAQVPARPLAADDESAKIEIDHWIYRTAYSEVQTPTLFTDLDARLHLAPGMTLRHIKAVAERRDYDCKLTVDRFVLKQRDDGPVGGGGYRFGSDRGF